jgi:predicted PurR-regulated permease PerM
MEVVYFTITAVVLYFAADRALNFLEHRRGARFEHRSLIFFAILVTLAVIIFALIQRLAGG